MHYSIKKNKCSINYLFLLYGRLLGGFAIGIIHYLIPIYINDIATPDNKQSVEYIIFIQFASGILTQYLYGKQSFVYLFSLFNKYLCCCAFVILTRSLTFYTFNILTNISIYVYLKDRQLYRQSNG